jgi:protein-S-isoprenylcysteine O-methyltransferase Ste14
MSVLKTLVFTILVPGTVTVVIPRYLLAVGAEGAIPFRLIGALPIALGAACYLWCAWDFASVGRGTPAPIDPPKVLVTRGLYRVVRNPMYVGAVLILLGESVLFASATLLMYTLLAWVVVHLFVVFYEEPTLRQKFGISYENYRKTVPRWIPRHKLLPI